MKEKRILNLLGQVNDDYIAEAAPPKSSKSKIQKSYLNIMKALFNCFDER